jgi:hypothetical protein
MAGKLTAAFRKYVRNLRLFKRGNRAEQLAARQALPLDLDALIEGMDDEENWDATDRRVYELLIEYEDKELPI